MAAVSNDRNIQGWRAIAPWLWTAFVGVAISYVAISYFEELGGSAVDTVLLPLGAVSMSALGALIATRAGGNRISWLFFVVGADLLFEAVAGLVVATTPPDPVTVVDVLAIAWVNSGYFFGLMIPVVLLLFVFPTGRLLSRRWTWVTWLTGVILIALFAAEWLAAEVGPDGAEWTVTNPFGFLPYEGLDDESLLTVVFGVGLIVLILTGPVCLFLRYRRSHQTVRTQIKWVAYALVLFPLNFIVGSIGAIDAMSDFVFVTTFSLIPISVAVSITRYRLYEIDRIISRTITYAVIVAVLAATFFAIVTGLALLLPTDSSLAIAASTLAVAGLFNPLRRRVQTRVDRRFNRAQYEAQSVVEELAGSIQNETDVARILERLVGAASQTMGPNLVGIWDNTGSGDGPALAPRRTD